MCVGGGGWGWGGGLGAGGLFGWGLGVGCLLTGCLGGGWVGGGVGGGGCPATETVASTNFTTVINTRPRIATQILIIEDCLSFKGGLGFRVYSLLTTGSYRSPF